MRVLVTGGAGFIGSNFVEMALTDQFPAISSVVVLDKITYAGKLSNLYPVANNSNFRFVQGDICDVALVSTIASQVDVIINFAAESHVDRSIESSSEFIQSNVVGTQVLLDAAKKFKLGRFIQVSTDEVYGSRLEGSWDENEPLLPNSPYAASKAAADLLVRAYSVTHGLNVNITRCSNNFGPKQNPEKLIPNFILKLSKNEKVPIYGDGMNVRDWLFVTDHCKAINLVLTKGEPGEIYNIGGGVELTNLELTRKLLKILNKDESFINYVRDRPGHDRRYSVDFKKIVKLGFVPSASFDESLILTTKWYKEDALRKGKNWSEER